MDVSPSVSALERELHEASPEALPALVAEIERLKAVAWVRLVSGSEPPATQGTAESLLTMKDVAARLNLPLSRVYELTRTRDGLPTTRIGKYKRVSPAALQAWLDHLPHGGLDTGGRRGHPSRRQARGRGLTSLPMDVQG